MSTYLCKAISPATHKQDLIQPSHSPVREHPTLQLGSWSSETISILQMGSWGSERRRVPQSCAVLDSKGYFPPMHHTATTRLGTPIPGCCDVRGNLLGWALQACVRHPPFVRSTSPETPSSPTPHTVGVFLVKIANFRLNLNTVLSPWPWLRLRASENSKDSSSSSPHPMMETRSLSLTPGHSCSSEKVWWWSG